MPYDPEHPVFRKPDDDDARVWRYLDLPRFLALLEGRSLYFARADTLGDPFEGSTTRATKAALEAQFASLDMPDEARITALGHFERLNRLSPKTHFLSCWHQSDHESEAMWKLYADAGVALQSSFGRLGRSLKDAKPLIYIGIVEYIDYDSAVIPAGNGFWPYLHKRESLEHERELRAIISGFVRHVYQAETFDVPGVRDELLQEARDQFGVELDPASLEPPRGLSIPVALDELIERIYVSPEAPPWYAQLVRSVVKRYELDAPVEHSRLGNDPIY